MPYESKAIANYLLDLAKGQHKQIDPMKMQKLAYFSHGWSLGLKDFPLVNERIEAWRYGPVIWELYNAFRDVGSGPITHPAYDVISVGNRKIINSPSIYNQEEDEQIDKNFTQLLLKEIWKVYGGFSGIQLSNLTHMPGTPWYETWHNSNQKNATIPDELMRKYFKAQAEKA